MTTTTSEGKGHGGGALLVGAILLALGSLFASRGSADAGGFGDDGSGGGGGGGAPGANPLTTDPSSGAAYGFPVATPYHNPAPAYSSDPTGTTTTTAAPSSSSFLSTRASAAPLGSPLLSSGHASYGGAAPAAPPASSPYSGLESPGQRAPPSSGLSPNLFQGPGSSLALLDYSTQPHLSSPSHGADAGAVHSPGPTALVRVPTSKDTILAMHVRGGYSLA